MSFLDSNTPIYIFTWNHDADPPNNHDKVLARALKGEPVVLDWKLKAHKSINIGDRCILVRTGPFPASKKGLVGWGVVCKVPYKADNYFGDSPSAYFVPINFECLRSEPLVDIDTIYKRFPFNRRASPWAPQACGVRFNEEQVPALLTLVSEISSGLRISDNNITAPTESLDSKSTKQNKSNKGQGYIRDAEKKHAIEMRGMEKAKEWLQKHGFKQIKDRSSHKSYDYSAYKNGQEYFVEVKGLTGAPTSVNMGYKEVELHQKNKGKTILLVVYGIKVTTNPKIKASGGRVKAFEPWNITSCKLKVTEYKILL